MSPLKVLVTYASRSTSTADVAAEIGKIFEANQLMVDVRPMEDVHDLTPYQAVVAGSAIRFEQWLPEAMTFLETHQQALKEKPFAAFLVCMALGIQPERGKRAASAWMQPVRDLVQPMSEGMFAGAIIPGKIKEWRYRIPFHVITLLLGGRSKKDYRDWDAIRAWAKGVAQHVYSG